MNRILSLIGLAYRAGKLKFGSDSVNEAIRGKRKPELVLIASDVSDNSLKRIYDGCAFHGVRNIRLSESMEELGHIIGGRSGVACAAVLDKGFAERIIELTGCCTAESK